MNQINRVLTLATAFFLMSVACILLYCFCVAVVEYNAILSRVFALCAVIIVLSFVSYIVVSLLLFIEHKTIINDALRLNNSIDCDATETNIETNSDRAISMFNDNASINEISIEIYGKKGGYYATKVKELLEVGGVNL